MPTFPGLLGREERHRRQRRNQKIIKDAAARSSKVRTEKNVLWIHVCKPDSASGVAGMVATSKRTRKLSQMSGYRQFFKDSI